MVDADRDEVDKAGDEVMAARDEADDDNRTEVAAGRPEKEATPRQEAALLDLLKASKRAQKPSG
jgi:hypothetical protein